MTPPTIIDYACQLTIILDIQFLYLLYIGACFQDHNRLFIHNLFTHNKQEQKKELIKKINKINSTNIKNFI